MRYLYVVGSLMASFVAQAKSQHSNEPFVPRTLPAKNDIVVRKGTSIQAAISSLSRTTTLEQSLFIEAGTYTEQVIIPPLAGPLNVYGYTTDTGTHQANKVTITHSASQGTAGSDLASGTVQNHAANSNFYNIDIKNTFGKSSNNGQAIALAANADRQGYYGVGLYSWQDTLLADTGKQVYAKCYIEGAVDYIFGQYARIWIDSSEIRSIGAGAITANGRDTNDPAGSYFAITRSTVAAATSAVVAAGSVYLGRPWRSYARVSFAFTDMTEIINEAGWSPWRKDDPQSTLDHVHFEEFNNTGRGATGARSFFTIFPSEPVGIRGLLGNDYDQWVNTAWLYHEGEPDVKPHVNP